MHWNQQYYVNTRLPCGLRSTPKIFTVVADALQWILLQQQLQDLIHYLDDYIFVEPPGQPGKALSVVFGNMCSPWGIHSTGKAGGTGHSAQFSGPRVGFAEAVNTPADDKLAHLQQLLIDWGDRKVCTKRELLSLIGVLQHSATVIRFGHCFLQRMIDLQHINSTITSG